MNILKPKETEFKNIVILEKTLTELEEDDIVTEKLIENQENKS